MLSTLCWQFGRLNDSCIEENIERDMYKESLYFILQGFVPNKIYPNNSKILGHFCCTHL